MPPLTGLFEIGVSRGQRLEIQAIRKCVILSSTAEILLKPDQLLTRLSFGVTGVLGTVSGMFLVYS